MYSKKNKAEIKSVAKKTRQGQGRNSVPKPGKKAYRGQGK
jgi:hypothetical protein|tara:strand:- start:445 stop:564 length:120 start_codon:yes stop_codon:yes gene_type:complete